MIGTIIKALSGFYYVSDNLNLYECKARGSFRNSGVSPLVGDKVEFEATDNGKGIINSVLPRRNELSRPPVANIDKLFIVSSFENPAPNTYIIDKISAIAVFMDIEPIIVFNKCDMGDFEDFKAIYSNSGFKVFVVSAETGEGIEELKEELNGCVSAFTGNSGVGKSSILNVLLGAAQLEVGEVSEKLGRGRHTTRHTELFPIKNSGFVADTPGFSAIEYGSVDYAFKESLAENFPEFSEFTGNCKFSSCSHTCEIGCGVIEAVEEGKIQKSRHNSYIALFEELKELKPWNTHKRK